MLSKIYGNENNIALLLAYVCFPQLYPTGRIVVEKDEPVMTSSESSA
jgi:hypothetical protein